MTNQHPITPPLELIQQWVDEYIKDKPVCVAPEFIAIRAAQWGADKELLACGNYLKQCAAWEEEDVIEFYNYRRPKPPSLKEKALAILDDAHRGDLGENEMATIRRVLEQLDD